MSSVFRKLLVIGAGAVLLAGLTAGTLSAASTKSKTYTVAVTPATLPYSTPTVTQTLHVTFTNTTPSATINSLTLTAPNASYAIAPLGAAPVSASSGNVGNYSISLSGTAPQTITVTNLYPVGYNESVTITFTVTVDTSSLDCSSSQGTWGTAAWTGSNLSGTSFTATTTATTSIGTALSPGASVTVDGVTVTNDSTTDCVPVTISRSGNSVDILKPTVSGLPLSVDVLWDPEPAANPLPPTETNTPLPPHAIPWCSGTVSAPALPNATDVSCLISETSQIAGSDTVQVHDLVYLLGDYSFQRGT